MAQGELNFGTLEDRFPWAFDKPKPYIEPLVTPVWELTRGKPDGDEDCVFCDTPPNAEFEYPLFDLAAPIADGDIALKAAMGMLRRPGYMLGVTAEHTTSFAQLGSATLAKTEDAFISYQARATERLGIDGYFWIEHGSDDVSSCGLDAGACVSHAHQHLIPGIGAAERMTREMDWQIIGAYENLADFGGRPYMYLGYGGVHRVVVNPRVRSQWARRIVAEEDGHQEWDWAVFPDGMTLIQTFISLGMYPRDGRIRVSSSTGYATFEPRFRPRGEGAYK